MQSDINNKVFDRGFPIRHNAENKVSDLPVSDKNKIQKNYKEDNKVTEEKMNPKNVSSDKSKALDQALLNIEKQFGKGAVIKMGGDYVANIDAVSTGSLPLDLALGIGGFPRGRIVEIYGPESSGKTTLTLHAIAEAQKKGGMAAFIDAEHALDPSYARKLGVNVDELLVSQPDSGEQALEITEALVRSNALDIIVIDSVAALVPRAEIEGEMGDSHMGLQARLMSQALRKLTGAIQKSNTILIFINQIRMKIGVMFGSPETTTGGNALKFYASIRLDIRRIESLTKGEDAIGNRVRVKVVKNKVAPPFRKVEFDVYFDKGISREACILDEAVNFSLINKSGTWYSHGDTRLGQGKENARQYLIQHPDLANNLEAEIRRKAQENPAALDAPKKTDSAKSDSDEIDQAAG
jgi:recombination protein RecA